MLYYFEERSIDHVAFALGLTREVVKQRLHRARKAAQAEIARGMESALETLRPGAAFTTAVIAAIAVLPVTKASAATTWQAKGGIVILKNLAIAMLVVLGVGSVALHALRTRRPAQVAQVATPPPLTTSQASSLSPVALASPRVGAHLISIPGERAALATAIESARERRRTIVEPTKPVGCAGDRCMDRYVEGALTAIQPMIMDCFGRRALSASAAKSAGNVGASSPDGGAAYAFGQGFPPGKLTVRLKIESEPGVGGIVSSSEVVENETTLADPVVRECVKETMFAIELDPSEAGDLTEIVTSFDMSHRAAMSGP